MIVNEIKQATCLQAALYLVNNFFSLKFVNITYKYQYLISEPVAADIFK